MQLLSAARIQQALAALYDYLNEIALACQSQLCLSNIFFAAQ